MTKSGSSTGGSDDANNLKEDAYDDFATYLARAAKWINQDLSEKYDTQVTFIEPLNEPDTNYWWNGSTKQEGCIFNTGELQSKAYREMQNALDAEGLSGIKITGTDETDLGTAIRSYNRLDDDVKENMDTIREAAEIQKENSRKLIGVASDITEYFSEAMKNLESLQSHVDASNFAMSNIADSSDSTAQAITRQAEVCGEIRNDTDRVESEMRGMIESSNRAGRTVSEGAEVVRDLMSQTREVEEAAGITVEVIDSLTKKVDEVQAFVGTILEISSQTNLLALNASIEAARAGEAGKGFAVVADEIRGLSEQTKDASNSITLIIRELMEDTKRANDSIDHSVASVTRQNELIENTREKFERVDTEVGELTRSIQSSERMVLGIVESTGRITDDIAHLSASSEEVAACAAEGLRTSETAVQSMKICKEVLENIFGLAQGLK